jgi:hypothetical protein
VWGWSAGTPNQTEIQTLLVARHLQAAAAAVTTGVDLVVNMCMRTASNCAVDFGSFPTTTSRAAAKQVMN